MSRCGQKHGQTNGAKNEFAMALLESSSTFHTASMRSLAVRDAETRVKSSCVAPDRRRADVDDDDEYMARLLRRDGDVLSFSGRGGKHFGGFVWGF